MYLNHIICIHQSTTTVDLSNFLFLLRYLPYYPSHHSTRLIKIHRRTRLPRRRSIQLDIIRQLRLLFGNILRDAAIALRLLICSPRTSAVSFGTLFLILPFGNVTSSLAMSPYQVIVSMSNEAKQDDNGIYISAS